MSASNSSQLLYTSLYSSHVQLGAKMVPFGGWEMPLQYKGILSEVKAVREDCGLFDVSHMGRIWFTGKDATSILEWLLPVRVERLRPGRARYTVLLDEKAGIIDDVVVYLLDSAIENNKKYLLVCNASTRLAVLSWINQWSTYFPDVVILDHTFDTAMIAVQGPSAFQVGDSCLLDSASSLKPFAVIESKIQLDSGPIDVLISRTGYTGENGFEVITPKVNGRDSWDQLRSHGGLPCGLGSRDTLRLEASLMLSGTDIDISTSPLEAGLDRFLDLEKEDKKNFVGKDALMDQKRVGLKRKFVGFVLQERGIPRHGYSIVSDNLEIGTVTSGGYSPTLDMGIGMGYVAVEPSNRYNQLEIDLRGRRIAINLVELPFYLRRKDKG